MYVTISHIMYIYAYLYTATYNFPQNFFSHAFDLSKTNLVLPHQFLILKRKESLKNFMKQKFLNMSESDR